MVDRFPARHNPAHAEYAFGADRTMPAHTWQWFDPFTGLGENDTYLQPEPFTIQRGRQDWASAVQPSDVTTRWWNPNGDLSPNLAKSPWFPNVRRWTPMRLWVPGRTPWAAIPNDSTPGSGLSTGDQGSWSGLTDRMWVKVDFTPQLDTSVNPRQWIAGQWASPNDAGWRIVFDVAAGEIEFAWTTDGTVGTFQSVTFDRWAARRDRRMTVAFQVDLVDGSVAMFFGGWTTLRHYRTLSVPVGDMHDPSAPLVLGYPPNPGPGTFVPPERIWRFEMRDWTATGTQVAFVDLTSTEQPTGTDPFASYPDDGSVLVWTVLGGAEVTNREYRFFGEVVAWQLEWPDGDVETEGFPGHCIATVSGIGQISRLSGGDPIRSALFRAITRAYETCNVATAPGVSGPVGQCYPETWAYWPLESLTEGQQVLDNPALTNAHRMQLFSAFDFDSQGFDGSEPNVFGGPIVADDQNQVNLFANLPAGLRAGRDQFTGQAWVNFPLEAWIALRTTPALGEIDIFSVRFGTNMDAYITVRGTDVQLNWFVGGSHVGFADFPVAAWEQIGVGWQQVLIQWQGSTLRGTIYSLNDDEQWATTISTPAQSFTHATRIGRIVGPAPPTPASIPGNIRYAHMLARYRDTNAILEGEQWRFAGAGHRGEQPNQRFTRLCLEQEVNPITMGDEVIDQPMGPQRPLTFMELIEEARKVAVGVIAEAPDQPGLVFRGAGNLRSQIGRTNPRGRTIPNELVNPYRVVDDDQGFANRVTVNSSYTGGVHQVEDITPGDPPSPLNESVNVLTDEQLPGQAEWRLTVASWEDPRVPEITIDLIEAPHMITRVLQIREGDIIRVVAQTLPSQHPEPVSTTTDNFYLLVDAITETIAPEQWTITFTCSPGEPWRDAAIPFPL